MVSGIVKYTDTDTRGEEEVERHAVTREHVVEMESHVAAVELQLSLLSGVSDRMLHAVVQLERDKAQVCVCVCLYQHS